jgi:hypothetical protein
LALHNNSSTLHLIQIILLIGLFYQLLVVETISEIFSQSIRIRQKLNNHNLIGRFAELLSQRSSNLTFQCTGHMESILIFFTWYLILHYMSWTPEWPIHCKHLKWHLKRYILHNLCNWWFLSKLINNVEDSHSAHLTQLWYLRFW